MAKIGGLEKELVAAVGIMQFPDEERENYLARLCRLITELPNAKWKALSREARLWSNDGADALSEGTDVPEPGRMTEPDDDEDEAEAGDVETETEEPAMRTSKSKVKTKKAPKKVAAKKAKKTKAISEGNKGLDISPKPKISRGVMVRKKAKATKVVVAKEAKPPKPVRAPIRGGNGAHRRKTRKRINGIQ